MISPWFSRAVSRWLSLRAFGWSKEIRAGSSSTWVPLRLPQRYGCGMTHARVWKFRPPAGREDEFERLIPDRQLGAAVRAGAGLSRDRCCCGRVEAGGWWLTIDRWETEAHSRPSRTISASNIAGLDQELEGVAGEEVFVGAFEE